MTLDELRKKIDETDAAIVELLNARYRTVLEIGRQKRSAAKAIYVPEREKAVFEKVAALNHGPMTAVTLQAVYREIMSGALALEHSLNIAYLGPEGTFSHLAAVSKFGHSVTCVPKHSTDDIFADVHSGKADYGCVPIENSAEGVAPHTLDLFLSSDVLICAEINLRTQRFSSGIRANPDNISRFLVIGKQTPRRTGNDKTTLCFSLKERSCVLYDALQPFKKAGIPLSMIESRPAKLRNCEYHFFIDLLGHTDDPAVTQALKELRPLTQAMRILGSYPKGDEVK